MIKKLFKKENNLFQSEEWLSFQKKYGREVVALKKNKASGLLFPLYIGKKFLWIQKSTVTDIEEARGIGNNIIFVRFEPEAITEEKIKKLKLRKVKQGSLLSGQKSPAATQVLDISGTQEEILAQMKPKTRYNIRLAEKKGVSVRSTENPEDVETFYELLKKTSVRNKREYVPHHKDYYVRMMEELAPKGHLKLFFAEYEGKPIAGIMVSFFGEVATYLHGGFSDEHKEVMAPYLCHDRAIAEAKNKGAKLYDFWGVAKDDDPTDPWAGITRFKKGFGGETIVFSGTFDLVLQPFWYNIFSVMAKLRKIGRR